MKPTERYVEEVLSRVFASAAERERFETDLRAHLEEALSAGESAGRVMERMGRPEDVAAAFNAERQPEYAGFWRRLLAFGTDLGLLLTLILPFLGVVLLVVRPTGPQAEPGPAALAVILLAGLAVAGCFLLYFPLLEFRFGRTLGKHLLRMRVIRESGAPIGLGQAFLRRLPYYFELLAPDALFIPFTAKRQRAFDIIAKTVVAKEPDQDTPWWSYALCGLLVVLPWLALWGVVVLSAPLAFGV